MKCFIIVVLLLIYPVAMFAKTSVDSLTTQLRFHLKPDTTKVNLLNTLGYEYWIVNPVQSEILGKKALYLADSLYYLKGSAFANRVIGVSCWARGQYAAALHYLMAGLTIYQQLNDKSGTGSMFNNIGLVYHDQGKYEVALKWFSQANTAYSLAGNNSQRAGILSNMGNTYLQMKNYARAEKIYVQVLHLNQALGNTYSIAESLSNLGELHLNRNKTDRALPYLLQSLDMRSAIDDHEGSAMCLYFIGKAYLHQKQFALAGRYLQRGLGKAQQVNSLKWLTNLYKTLKDLAVASGNHEQAIAYFESFSAYKDSLFNREQSRQLAEMQARFESVEKEQQLQAQAKKLALLQGKARFQTLLKNSLLIGMFALGLITYLIISNQHLKIKRNKELLLENDEIFRKEQSIVQLQLENARSQETQLLEELECTNKKLTSYSLNFIQKNELMEEVKANINTLKKMRGSENTKELNGLNRLVENSLHIDRDWEDFKRNFEGVHKDFYQVLKEYYPDLTSHELKLCSLLKLNMNLKEAAAVMGISPESVKKARYRLRKKFNLTQEENLIDHIIGLSKHLTTENKLLA